MLENETMLSIADACEALPRRRGKLIHFSTVWRWTKRGCRGVRLETLPVGGLLYTSREAIGRFMGRLAEARARPAAVVAPRSRRAQQKVARRILDKAGW